MSLQPVSGPQAAGSGPSGPRHPHPETLPPLPLSSSHLLYPSLPEVGICVPPAPASLAAGAADGTASSHCSEGRDSPALSSFPVQMMASPTSCHGDLRFYLVSAQSSEEAGSRQGSGV